MSRYLIFLIFLIFLGLAGLVVPIFMAIWAQPDWLTDWDVVIASISASLFGAGLVAGINSLPDRRDWRSLWLSIMILGVVLILFAVVPLSHDLEDTGSLQFYVGMGGAFLAAGLSLALAQCHKQARKTKAGDGTNQLVAADADRHPRSCRHSAESGHRSMSTDEWSDQPGNEGADQPAEPCRRNGRNPPSKDCSTSIVSFFSVISVQSMREPPARVQRRFRGNRFRRRRRKISSDEAPGPRVE